MVEHQPEVDGSIPSAFSFFWCLNVECLLVFKRDDDGTYNQKKRSKRKKRDWQSLVRKLDCLFPGAESARYFHAKAKRLRDRCSLLSREIRLEEGEKTSARGCCTPVAGKNAHMKHWRSSRRLLFIWFSFCLQSSTPSEPPSSFASPVISAPRTTEPARVAGLDALLTTAGVDE